MFEGRTYSASTYVCKGPSTDLVGGTDAVITPEQTAQTFEIADNGYNIWITFRPEAQPDYTVDLKAQGFKYAGTKGAWWARRDDCPLSTEDLQALCKRAIADTVQPDGVHLNTCAHCGGAFVWAHDCPNPEDTCYSCFTAPEPEMPEPEPDEATLDNLRRWYRAQRIFGRLVRDNRQPVGVIALGDGKPAPAESMSWTAIFTREEKPTKKQGKLPVPSARPVFGQIPVTHPKAPEPPSVLTLAMQDGRTPEEIETQQRKAEESLTIPMFGGAADVEPPPFDLNASLMAAMGKVKCPECQDRIRQEIHLRSGLARASR